MEKQPIKQVMSLNELKTSISHTLYNNPTVKRVYIEFGDSPGSSIEWVHKDTDDTFTDPMNRQGETTFKYPDW